MGDRWSGRDARAESAVWFAVAAVRTGVGVETALQRLGAHGAPAVATAAELVDAAVAQAGERGWSRDDLRHVVSRRTSPRHVARPPLGETARPAAVHAPDELRMLVEVLAIVALLPQVPAGGSPAHPDAEHTPSGLDPRVLRRVRALLNKAESTDFPEEAEALTAKAQELIARHAIDAISLGDEASGGPVARRVYLDDPYVDAKSSLLGSVAAANRCSTVFTPAFAWSTVFGFPADLDAVELLFESLLAQAAHALALEGSRVDARGRSRTRSFRRSFLYGFAHRIGQRLVQATQAQVDEAGAANAALLPALARRDERVHELERATYPTVRRRSVSLSNGAGWAAGQAAAEVADLSVGARRVGRGR